ncbi:MAG: hypothetical protein ACOC8E_03415 [Planctomycetota bacterium]
MTWAFSGLSEAGYRTSGLSEADYRTSGPIEAGYRTSGLSEAGYRTSGLIEAGYSPHPMEPAHNANASVSVALDKEERRVYCGQEPRSGRG